MTGRGAWGEDKTQFFFSLTPDRVLEAVEASGLRCTGRCATLNSFENRVYEVELDLPDPENERSPVARRRVVKFYRPGRWSEEQILEEHEFLADLREAEIPVVAPASFPDGKTLHAEKGTQIRYAVFQKVGGRAPEELTDEQLMRIGRLLGRIHNVGAARKAAHRIALTPTTYGLENLGSLLSGGWVPLEFRSRYESAARSVCELTERLFEGKATLRIHGDCHLGNLLWNQDGPFFLDFDDMLRGPAIQDLWLVVPGRDEDSRRQREVLLEGYEEMRNFDRSELALIEPLRALRFIHYTAWLARRWDDPAFPRAFPDFNSHRYWADETADLEEQLRLIREHGEGRPA